MSLRRISFVRRGFLLKSFFALAMIAQPLCWAQEPTKYSRKIALLIGLGHYQAGQGKGTFRDLPLVANDLISLKTALTSIGFDEVHVFSDLEPPAAARDSFRTPLKPGESKFHPVNSGHLAIIISDLLESLEESKERNLLLVYLSGHGGVFGKSDRVLAAPDSTVKTPGTFYRIRKLLNELADKAESTDKYVVVDACAERFEGKGEDIVTRTEEELPPYLFSSQLGEASFIDPEVKQSVFTFHFVNALTRGRELNLLEPDGSLSTREVRNYLEKRVPLHRNLERKKQSNAVILPQRPYGSMRSLTLAVFPDPVPAPKPEASRQEIDAYTNSLLKGHYIK